MAFKGFSEGLKEMKRMVLNKIVGYTPGFLVFIC